MKVRNLLLVAAFVLGGLTVAHWGDIKDRVRNFEYTKPIMLWTEGVCGDLTGASRRKVEAELAKALTALDAERARCSEIGAVLDAVETESQLLAAQLDVKSSKASDLQLRVSQLETELVHQRQLLEAQQFVTRDAERRYAELRTRIAELGRDSGTANVAAE